MKSNRGNTFKKDNGRESGASSIGAVPAERDLPKGERSHRVETLHHWNELWNWIKLISEYLFGNRASDECSFSEWKILNCNTKGFFFLLQHFPLYCLQGQQNKSHRRLWTTTSIIFLANVAFWSTTYIQTSLVFNLSLLNKLPNKRLLGGVLLM